MDELKKEYNEILKVQDYYLEKALGTLTQEEYLHINKTKIRADTIIKELLDKGHRSTTSEIIHGFKGDDSYPI